jgi:spermidine/putrescine transport system substrate-binding protein
MKTVKKLLAIVLMLAMIVTTAAVFVACNPANVLIVYNWGDYIGADIVADFEAYYAEVTGKPIRVIYSTYDTNETMLTQIIDGKEVVDLICPSEYAIQRLLVNGYLQPIDKTKLTNIGNIEQGIYTKTASVFTDIELDGTEVNFNDYYIPYMWGTLGILYNAENVTQADLDEGWGLLWNANNNPLLNAQDKIFMKDSIRDVYVAAVLRLKEIDELPEGNYSSMTVEQLINCTDQALLDAVEALLIEQKELNPGYEVDTGKDEVVEGNIFVNLAWSGDAFYTMEVAEIEYERELGYFVPNNEGNIWFDGWVMHKDAKNPEAALMFLDYLCGTEVAMSNAVEIGYTSAVDKDILSADPNATAILEDNEYDTEDYFSDELRYPDFDTASYGVMKDFGAREAALKLLWQRVKSA